jgi:hypothetical protein
VRGAALRARPARSRRESPAQSLLLVRSLLAVLNRNLIPSAREQYPGDDNLDACPEGCAGCAAIRVVPFACTQCGYTGTPFVTGCSCLVGARRQRTFARRALSQIRRGVLVPKPGDYQLDHYERFLADAQRILTRNRPCHPGPSGSTREEPCCGHGLTMCPACIGDDDRVLDMVRELRTILAAAPQVGLV